MSKNEGSKMDTSETAESSGHRQSFDGRKIEREVIGDAVALAYHRGYVDGVESTHPLAVIFVGIVAGAFAAYLVMRIFVFPA